MKKSKIPRWKYWLSHLRPVSLEVTNSELNEYLEVVLERGRIQLVAGDAIYSYDDLYVNFVAAFDKMDILANPPKEVLVLGLGLGSIPFMLEKKYGIREAYYTAVEIDEEVAFLAEKYSLYRLQSPVECLIADAEQFVSYCGQTFDLICMDIFQDDFTPPQFETSEFLDALDALLDDGGTLLYNRLYHNEKEITFTNRFWEEVFLPKFPAAQFAESSGNRVFMYKK